VTTIRTRWVGCLAALVLLGTANASLPAHAAKAKPEWNQIENVKGAAKRLGELQLRQGSEAALKFLEACYKTHMLAEKYTEGLEACMAQDYMLSQLLAVIYAKVPADKLAEMKAPSADVIARAMRGRFQAIFQQYKITQQEADSLKKAVDEHGMPVFIKLVFPNTGKKKEGENAPAKDAPAGDGEGGDPGGVSGGGGGVHIPKPEGEPK